MAIYVGNDGQVGLAIALLHIMDNVYIDNIKIINGKLKIKQIPTITFGDVQYKPKN